MNKPAEVSSTESAGNTVQSRFSAPDGYTRQATHKNSFGNFLQNLPLKPVGSNVRLYNGEYKSSPYAYLAVIDLPIGTKNLHQCADAVIRLRSDYLRHTGQSDKIHFNFTNGFTAYYSKWKEGYRIKIEGNNTSWQKTAAPADTDDTYWKYLETVFMFAGTYSLSKELTDVSNDSLKIGDVFIQGGFPGHAVIIIDIAQNQKGEKRFMLAQSYMPAQELQVLCNPQKPESAWYYAEFGNELITPEWKFSKQDRKRFLEEN